jgi:hypothetical protein
VARQGTIGTPLDLGTTVDDDDEAAQQAATTTTNKSSSKWHAGQGEEPRTWCARSRSEGRLRRCAMRAREAREEDAVSGGGCAMRSGLLGG